MTLDPVHFDGIAALARRITQHVDEQDHRDAAETVWQEFLDPLRHDGDVVLEPLDGVRRRKAPVQELALQPAPFDAVNGLDSGTINPRTFKNGLVLDIAQAAMSATPSDLDLHRSRTVVASVHSNDATVDYGGNEWDRFDAGYGRGRIIKAPPVNRFEDAVVHSLSLYLAESAHALQHADAVSDLLVLDGPLYPKGLLNWREQSRELAHLLTEHDIVREAIENYLRLVERFVDRDVPLVGFVKNTSARGLTNVLRTKTHAPWAHDMAFFSQVLERRDGGERLTDDLTWTNWFRSRLGADATFSTRGDGLSFDRALDADQYEVTFFVVYDPRTDIGYKVEAPYAFTRDPEVRAAIERQVLRDVAAERGPPLAVAKADELARISVNEKHSLVGRLEDEFGSDVDRNYDDERWEKTG
ncbi:DNA double-strand break repair nuclease NurA [Halobacteriaceae archaeon GCM10025711]